MMKAIAINGSPRMKKGNTAMILDSFLKGMKEAGATTELFYTMQLKIKPCTCGKMYCWNEEPGKCCIKDDMELLYPKLREVDILILATPVYIPLPSKMQNVINRLCPLVNPVLELKQGRTRARFHKNVKIGRIVLVSTCGWWEIENFKTVKRIAKELAKDVNVEFAGAVLRPHASQMRKKGELTKDGETVLEAVKIAGYELVKKGSMSNETLEIISRHLISEKLWHKQND